MSNVIIRVLTRKEVNQRMMKRQREIQKRKREYEKMLKNWKPTYTVIKNDV
jgi:hypothetical protein